MRLSILLLISLFIINNNYAQDAAPAAETTLTGTILGKDEAPLPYAAVALHDSKDSTLITGAATDMDGNFELSAPKGAYYLKIKFLSYQTKLVEVELKSKELALGNIQLEEDLATTEEVVVETERAAMELQLDKRVFNVDADPVNKGRTASEILDNLPSVVVDMDGNVSFRGNQNVRILIDGKPSGLVGMRGAAALQQLQGNMIERIEIISNPSARYDAEGEVGIINIVLKKDKKRGVNGSFDVRAGWPEDFGGGFNLNYRTGAVNLFASYGIGYRRRPGGGSSFQEFDDGDTTFSYDRVRVHERGGLSNNIRVGTNIFITERDVLTFSGLYTHSFANNDATLTYTDYDQFGDATNTEIRDDNEFELEYTTEASMNYEKTFKDHKDHKLTFNFQFTDEIDGESSTIIQSNNNPNSLDLEQRVSNTENQQRWLMQSDYVHPFAKDGKFETGVRIQLRDIENDFGVDELQNDEWVPLGAFNNNFQYTENIYAAYVMAGNKWGKFSAQAGLRYEYSDVTSDLVETNEVNRRTYGNFFPSAHLSYEFKKQNSLQVSYSRRINRPRFWYLVPFVGFSDNRNIYGGNPDLDPEYTNSFELTHLKYFKKGSIMSSAYFRQTTNKMDRLLFSDSLGITQRFPVNYGEELSLGFEFSATYRPFEWWELTSNVNFYRSIINGEYQGTNLDRDTYAWNNRSMSKWNFKKGISFQVVFNYRSPMISVQGRTLSRYHFDAGFTMDILKGNGTLTLNARDIFNTRRWRWISFGDNFYSEGDFQWRARQITLNFSYRLNQPKKKGGRPDKG